MSYVVVHCASVAFLSTKLTAFEGFSFNQIGKVCGFFPTKLVMFADFWTNKLLTFTGFISAKFAELVDFSKKNIHRIGEPLVEVFINIIKRYYQNIKKLELGE